LELLNAACINRPCREVVSKKFGEWLSHILTNGSGSDSLSCSKTLPLPVEGFSGSDARIFARATAASSELSEQKVEHNSHAIEGLAYTSVKPSVKDQLANDPVCSKTLPLPVEGFSGSDARIFARATAASSEQLSLPARWFQRNLGNGCHIS
jgi:hypothetical protein